MNIFTLLLGILMLLAALWMPGVTRHYGGRAISLGLSLVVIAIGAILLYLDAQPPKTSFPPVEKPTTQTLRGTLHQATSDQWRKADYANRLATAADFIARLRQAGKLDIKVYTPSDLKPWATALDICIRRQGGAGPQAMLAYQLAETCAGPGLLKYMEPLD